MIRTETMIERLREAGFLETCRLVAFKQGDEIISPFRHSDSLIVLRKGILRSFYWHNGINCTAWFTLSGEIIYDFLEYGESSSIKLGVEAVTDSEAMLISRKDFEKWCGQSIYNSSLGRKLYEEYATTLNQRLIEYFLCDTAEQRYLMIMKKYPEILQQIPLSQLASYIDITPQSLSRIRRQLNSQ